MKIGILTDSTADLTEELKQQYQIHTISLSVHFEEEVYTDGVDITPDFFFRKLHKDQPLPRTARPPVSIFKEKYQEMAEKYDKIISLHLSDNLSGTLDAAKLAAQQLPEIEIHPLDSSSISLGLGFQVLTAAELIEQGKPINQIKEKLRQAKENLLLYFTVDEFTYMERGGRIGKARAFLGSILNINPIISISTETGEVDPLKKTRGQKRTMNKMVNIARQKLKGASSAWIGFAHGDRKNDMESFKERVLNLVENDLKIDYQTYQSRISPTLGCHVGPSVYAGFILVRDFLD